MDKATSKLALAACLLSRGSIRHQKSAARSGDSSLHNEIPVDIWAKKANEDFDAAMLIFTDKTLMATELIQCKKGQGRTFTLMGKLKYAQNLFQDTKVDWTYALDLYTEISDDASVEEVTDLLEELDRAMAKAAFIRARIAHMSAHEDKEQTSVKAAFHKFDADNSGHMDAEEFGLLAVELGTEPPLRPDELQEGLKQLDEDGTGDISFEEFWKWWCSERVEAAASAAFETNLS
jgi:Ca2+-binding EF-hand superfamily protein